MSPDSTALLVLLTALPACFSFPLPDALDRSERELVDSTHFAASVGVAAYRHPAWSDSLIDVLRGTGLFDTVEPLEKIHAIERRYR